MATDLTEEEDFASLVLSLKKRNPSWKGADIAAAVSSYEKKPKLKRDALRRKINRILKRGTAKRKIHIRVKTVRTEEFKVKVKQLIKLKKGRSQRKVTETLQNQDIKCSRRTVGRAIDDLGLKPFKQETTQDLSAANKEKRVECAKKLRKKFGTRKDRKWRWNSVINTDFSGIFTLAGFQNRRNTWIYAEKKKQIKAKLKAAPKQKFAKGLVFWGAITSYGLIPKNGPINITKWLQKQKLPGTRGKVYMTGELYALFLRTQVIPAIKKVVGNDLRNVIWQDDQDSKHRTVIAMDTINEFFEERIEREDGDAKFADVWPIENIWGLLKERIRGVTFKSQQALMTRINKEWKQISIEFCQSMMNKIPSRLLQVIEKQGEQI